MNENNVQASKDATNNEITELKVNFLRGAGLVLFFWMACIMGLIFTCAFVKTNLSDTVIVAILVTTLFLVVGGGYLILKELFHKNKTQKS